MKTIQDVLPWYNLASAIINQAEIDNDEDSKNFLTSELGKQLKNEIYNFEKVVYEAWDKNR